MKNAFFVGSGAPAPLVLFVASLVRSMGRTVHALLVEEEPIDLVSRDPILKGHRIDMGALSAEPLRVIGCGTIDPPPGLTISEAWQLTIVSEPQPEVRLEGPRGRHRFALAVSPEILLPYERLVSQVPRVLVEWDQGETRREKMVIRVMQEARRRKWPHVLVAVGGERSLVGRTIEPDEHYSDPTAAELAALLMSTSMVLDPSDESAAPSAVARLAQSVAIPLITHASSALARRVTTEVRLADEWSPDAFCELLIATRAPLDGAIPWGLEFETIADDFVRVLTVG